MLNLNALNPQQRLAVETIHGPVLILAGAGTGKTRVITFRIAHLIDKGVAPHQILAVTFTNKAAREMKERVGGLVRKRKPGEPRDESAGPTICTFHSLGARLLRQHIEVFGYKKNFVIYSESEQLAAVKKILSHISAKGEAVDPKVVLSFLSRLKNGALSPNAFADESGAVLARHIRSRYESALHACNAVDFDDLLVLALRLFQEHPNILAACREKYRYVMVDEYQDTNAAQFKLVGLLTEKHRNLCVVGDDDQSIYAWRGAEIANLLDLEKHYPEVKIIKLEQNYRSTNTILQAANAVITHNARRRKKQLWSQNGQGTKIALHTFENDEEEARSLVEQMEFTRLARRVPWRDHAILFRTNQQSRPLEVALRQAGVAYHLIGGQSYFDRREVKDFLSYLKVFINPHDDVSLLRIANVPARGLSDVTMERLLSASQERHCSVYAAMRHTDVQAEFQARTRQSLLALLELIDRRRAQLMSPDRIAVLPPPEGEGRGEGEQTIARPGASRVTRSHGFSLQRWADTFLEEIGYIAELRRSEKNADSAENRVRNLKELVVMLEGQPAGDAPSERVQNFLEEISLDTDREEEETERGDAVTLITMHSCKGLEFPHVHVVGIEDGLLPHSRSKLEGTLDEERRLFYVAMTRAMQTLTLSYCLARKRYGQLLPCHPSAFLKELPADLIELADEKAKEPVAPAAGQNYFALIRQSLG
jgi:superfamily I DNA/RNA helicase